MTREELINSKEYQVTTAAIKKYNNYPKEELSELDYIDGFEDGSEWMQNLIMDKVCTWIKNNMVHFCYTDEESIINQFRQTING